MSFSKAVVKNRVLILIITFLLLIPSVFGYINTRVNYDMLDYLPQNMETVIGQDELLKEFGKGAFSFVIVENMTPLEVAGLKEKIEKVDHVESVIWYDSIFDLTVPMEMLPKKLYDAFNTDNSTIMAVFYDTSTSADETMQAIESIRKIADKECFVSGMSALVTDLKELCEREEPIYVAIAVLLALIAMQLLLDSFLAPIVFLLSIGMMILLNLGSNIFFGEISYITKALSAVLQLAVTMDYSIFLWHSYNEQRERFSDNKEAMMVAIRKTLSSVIGSSVTTVAGFIALCFMSFTMGRDLGLVMAKGVLIGVIGCVTVLPSLILVLDKPLQKSRHRSLIPGGGKISKGIVKIFPVFLLIFAILIVPSYYIYRKAGNEVYYDISQSIPQDMPNVVANNKLKTEFHMATQHMVLTDSTLDPNETRKMINEMEQVDGVNYVLSLESLIGA
ncbi:MAG: MMPL family transporter, partial [Clostridiales bacterium]|nr:MMPL family transporter [Clostridiales bacterium]